MKQIAYIVTSDEFRPTIFTSWEELVGAMYELQNPIVSLPIKISLGFILEGEEDGN